MLLLQYGEDYAYREAAKVVSEKLGQMQALRMQPELTYEQLSELLGQSEVTRDALHRAADAHEQEHQGREAES